MYRRIVTNGTATVTIRDLIIQHEGWGQPAIRLNDNANLTLNIEGVNSLTSTVRAAGINVPVGTTLTIDGSGELTAQNTSEGIFGNSAGIGGSYGQSAGTIIIYGGTVIANGPQNGAGIGGAHSGNGGTVTINGGVVTATGTNNNPGIGAGNNATDGGTLTINDDAVVFVNRLENNINTRANITRTSGILSVHDVGLIYGDEFTIRENVTIPEGHHLLVGENQTLTLAQSITLTNNGLVFNLGTINHGNTHGTWAGNPFINGFYFDADGNLQTIELAGLRAFTGEALTNGWWVVSGETNVSGRIAVNGNDVTLILVNGAHLDASNGGIHLTGANSLTIYAQSTDENEMGTLTAQGGTFQAGIGGNNGQSGGNITINGGNIIATGGLWAAGIGGGRSDAWGAHGAGGNISISGSARVISTGREHGAGIGGGASFRGAGGVAFGHAGNITISGNATVISTGGGRGAGIGGGGCHWAYAAGNGGIIHISGNAQVSASAGEDPHARSIGAGVNGDGTQGAVGELTISDSASVAVNSNPDVVSFITIEQNPADVVIPAGSPLEGNMSFAASHAAFANTTIMGNFTYQWYFYRDGTDNVGVPFAGATSTTFDISNIDFPIAGSLTVFAVVRFANEPNVYARTQAATITMAHDGSELNIGTLTWGSYGNGWSFDNGILLIENGANVAVTGTTTGRRIHVAENATAILTIRDISLTGTPMYPSVEPTTLTRFGVA